MAEIDVKTAEGVSKCKIYRGKGERLPAILLVPDAFGVRPASELLATRYAEKGYFVLVPDVLYRAGDYAPFDPKTVWTVPAERERVMKIIQMVDHAAAMRDASAYLDAIAAQPGVAGDKVGCVGFCLGGRIVYGMAGAYPDRVAAASSIHPGRLVTDAPDSPHRVTDRIRGSIYLGIADNDPSCTPEHQGVLAAALGAAHVRYQLELHVGKAHGFAFSDVPAYDVEAYERHFERTTALFDSTLRA